MTATTERQVSPTTSQETDELSRKHERRRDGLAALVVCFLVGVFTAIPLAWNRIFYYWDDSAAQFLPTWHHLGERIASGDWPTLLDLDMWAGGNLAAEALFGVYNPINALNYLMVAALPDLAVAAILVKAEFMAVLALGVYLVCREYGGSRWASVPVAVALPFAGFTLYFDSAVWASGLMAFAYVPHMWWSLRRVGRGALNPIWAFIIGALAITAGNPYGVLGVCVVVGALLIEFGVKKLRRSAMRVLLVGLCVGATVPLVYLPVVGSTAVTLREAAGFVNTGFMVPGIGDLLNMSMPAYIPMIETFDGPSVNMPVTYFAWFITPLIPWLSWRKVRENWRSLSGIAVFSGFFLLVTLGPSNLWMFRWPLRMVEYLYLGLAIVFALALSSGLRTDRVKLRTLATAAILLVGTYLSIAVQPDRAKFAIAGLAILIVLSGLAIVAAVKSADRRKLTGVLCVGIGVVLSFQTWAIPGNFNVIPWHMPHSVSKMRDTFADRYEGTTMQIASAELADKGAGLYPAGAYQYFLFGNAYLPADVDSVNHYSGMGFKKFDKAFCFNYYGATCADAYHKLWEPTRYDGESLADLMKVETVVVQDALVPEIRVPSGWHITRDDEVVTVLRRNGSVPWSEGRLSWASEGLEVYTDKSQQDTHEVVRFERETGSDGTERMAFARLNWPGYTASVSGQEVRVETGPAGLVVVEIPPGVEGGALTLEWSPPGLPAGVWSFIVGLVGAVSLGAWSVRWRRTRRDHSDAVERI